MSLPYHHSDSSKPVVERSAEDTMASIPQPPMHWVIGNAAEMDPKFPASSIWRLADLYGPIFKLNIVGREFLVLSNFELINEVMDDDRFEKYVGGGLEQVRALAGDGLFTAYGNEPVSTLEIRDHSDEHYADCDLELGKSSSNSDPRFWSTCHSQNVPRDARHWFTVDPEVGQDGSGS